MTTNLEEIMAVLKRATLFSRFTDKGVGFMAAISVMKHLPAGTLLFAQHMMGEGMFIVAEGELAISVKTPSGRDIPLGVAVPGDSLGEVALLRPGQRQCSVMAKTPCRVLEITRRDLAGLQRSKPQACLKLMMAITTQVGERLSEVEPDLLELLDDHLRP